MSPDAPLETAQRGWMLLVGRAEADSRGRATMEADQNMLNSLCLECEFNTGGSHTHMAFICSDRDLVEKDLGGFG